MKKHLYILIIIPVLQVIADNFFQDNNKALYHITQTLANGGWLILIYLVTKNWYIPLIYLFARVLLYSPIWNLLNGKQLMYCGSTCFYDIYICSIVHSIFVYPLLIFLFIIILIKFYNN